jgi:hypothetical protein
MINPEMEEDRENLCVCLNVCVCVYVFTLVGPPVQTRTSLSQEPVAIFHVIPSAAGSCEMGAQLCVCVCVCVFL